jgi:hypothetical protein
MGSSLILFSPNFRKIDEASSYIDSLSCDEILTELFIGEIMIVESSSSGTCLFLEKVDPIGFVLNLRLRLDFMKDNGVATERLVSLHQHYDIEINTEIFELTMHDRCQSKSCQVRLDAVGFYRNVVQCSKDMYRYLRLFFPTLSERQDFDAIENWFDGSS